MKLLALILCLGLTSPARAAQHGDRPRVEERQAQNAPARTPEPITKDEAAALEQRDERPGPEVAGGSLSNQQLTYVVIALATAVLMLLILR